MTQSDRSPASEHLYLIGYRGSGKSTVARLLGQSLQLPWIDADQKIELDSGKPITEIFRDQGEQAFRDLETAAIVQISRMPAHVVALGGGAILRPENRQCIRATGTAVWLDARADVLCGRISQDAAQGNQRPHLTNRPADQEVRELLQMRRPLYEQTSQWRIDVSDLTPDDVCAAITRWIASREGA